MLRVLKELYGYDILALDGEIGKVHDFYFDDEEWVLRYLVVNTGPWILGRKVLISPLALGQPDWVRAQFPVNLTREQVKDSPDILTDQPVSRQQQIALHEYFRWPVYWGAAPVTPIAYVSMQAIKEEEAEKEKGAGEADPHLRRAKEVIGYHIQGRDGGLGTVHDFILDDESWILRYLVLDTTGQIEPAKLVLIAPFWIQSISYKDSRVDIDLTRQMIKDSTEFDPDIPISREYEEILYDYFGKPYYWIKR